MDKLDKLIDLLEERRKELFNFGYHDKEFIDGAKSGLKTAIRIAKKLKEDGINE